MEDGVERREDPPFSDSWCLDRAAFQEVSDSGLLGDNTETFDGKCHFSLIQISRCVVECRTFQDG